MSLGGFYRIRLTVGDVVIESKSVKVEYNNTSPISGFQSAFRLGTCWLKKKSGLQEEQSHQS